MVNIILDSRHTLINDSKQWVITKDGNWLWFYTSLLDALEDWYYNEKPKQSRAVVESELLEYIKKQQERLSELLTSLKKQDLPEKLPIVKEKENGKI